MTVSAFAQATRTWVSGVGDDANPCSRTAPCKTFAGAISKTASGGIIDALDPGGFGAVTITKPITIEGNGTLASVLSSGVQGIIVNITSGTNRDVILRNILIDGSGVTIGTNGINFMAGDSLTVEDCYITRYSTTGILFQPNSNAQLTVRRTGIYLAAIGIRTTGVGAVTASSSISDSNIAKNGTGLQADQNSKMTVRNSYVNGNTADGILGTSSSSCSVTVDFTVAANNGTGIRSNGAGTEVRVNNSTITGNGTGVSSTASGQICTYTSNRVAQNGSPGAFNCTGTNL
ncbi:MAG TPA: right-handed parallel beta-helix repeat-containing protein [Thermoanaerobaculia bacterium]|nr:right-handed parallel beta-helix repeat-containing protein [Thermoanaerobaculia bacterium]